jgi:hypothetical protein
MNLNEIFSNLWETYTSRNPSAKKVHELFESKGENVINDHIAFRTFDDPRVNIDVLARPFLANGYEYRESYKFEEKKLTAKHYEHPGEDMPRIFISQLETSNFSDFLQDTVKKCIDAIPEDKLNSDELIFAGNLWGTPSHESYEKLRAESEYAAWLYYNGFCANHFTVSVDRLRNFGGIREVNEFLKENGFLMNDSGGEVKGSPESLLEQSSIKADIVNGKFAEGEFDITGCYYEFAKRYPGPDGKLFSGFIAKSADKIFESTDFYKKG